MRNDEWRDVFSYEPWGFNPAKCFSFVLPTERGGMMPRYEIVGNDGDVLQLYNIWGEQFLWLSTETLRRRAGWFTLNPTITGERISQKWLGHTYIHIYTVLYIWTYYGIRSGENTTPCPLQHLALFWFAPVRNTAECFGWSFQRVHLGTWALVQARRSSAAVLEVRRSRAELQPKLKDVWKFQSQMKIWS
jgi:hypothetical protein